MGSLIITYDLRNEVRRPPIVDEVRRSPGYAMLSESCYAISTGESVSEVYDRFAPLIDEDDSFYVLTLRAPWKGFGFKNVNDWLQKHLVW